MVAIFQFKQLLNQTWQWAILLKIHEIQVISASMGLTISWISQEAHLTYSQQVMIYSRFFKSILQSNESLTPQCKWNQITLYSTSPIGNLTSNSTVNFINNTGKFCINMMSIVASWAFVNTIDNTFHASNISTNVENTTVTLAVIMYDQSNISMTGKVRINVTHTNVAPVVNVSLANQAAIAGKSFPNYF